MNDMRIQIAQRLFVAFLQNDNFINRSVDYINGIVWAKTSVALDQEWMIETAKQLRGTIPNATTII